MKSFQAKIGQRKPRKRENENSRSVPFRSYSMHNGKLQRNSKKIKNNKKNQYGVISSQNRLENSVKERK